MTPIPSVRFWSLIVATVAGSTLGCGCASDPRADRIDDSPEARAPDASVSQPVLLIATSPEARQIADSVRAFQQTVLDHRPLPPTRRDELRQAPRKEPLLAGSVADWFEPDGDAGLDRGLATRSDDGEHEHEHGRTGPGHHGDSNAPATGAGAETVKVTSAGAAGRRA